MKVKKARAMMWVLKVEYRARKVNDITRSLERKKRATGGSFSRVTSIEVLQSSNATSARLWAEDGIGLTKGKERENEMGKKKAAAMDNAFIANMPKDLNLSDCIVDKSKFKTIEEQRARFEKRMLEMAGAGHDEEDGWKFYRKTNYATEAKPQQYVSKKRKIYICVAHNL